MADYFAMLEAEIRQQRYNNTQHRRSLREQLAHRIEHTARETGDAAGDDIPSYEEAGTDRFIEAKTTRYGRETPFSWRVRDCSGRGTRAPLRRFQVSTRRAKHLFHMPCDELQVRVVRRPHWHIQVSAMKVHDKVLEHG